MMKSRLIKKKSKTPKKAKRANATVFGSFEADEVGKFEAVLPVTDNSLDEYRFELPTRRKLYQKHDFTCLVIGLNREDLAPNHRPNFKGDYRGRPQLARQLLNAIKQKIRGGSQSGGRQLKNNLGNLYRALDRIESGCQFKVDRLEDISNEVAELIFVHMIDSFRHSYSPVKTILTRSINKHLPKNQLAFPAAPRSDSEIRFREQQRSEMQQAQTGANEDSIRIPTDEEMKRVARAILAETKMLLKNFEEGRQLVGCEPSQTPRNKWFRREYVAKQFHSAITTAMPTGGFTRSDLELPVGLSKGVLPVECGPMYMPPSMKKVGTFVNSLRWFIPTAADMNLLALHFLVLTGWNIEVALRLDVSDKENWVFPHPIDTDLMILKSVKMRAGGVIQHAVSKRDKAFHPYQIIRSTLEITGPLRDCLRAELDTLSQIHQHPYSHEVQVRVNRIIDTLKSPWLYFNTNEIGRIGSVDTANSWRLTIALRALLDKHGHDDLHWMTVSDFRDGYISDVYAASGHQYIVAQLASGHSDIKSLRHYLSNKLWRNKSFTAIRRFQDALFKLIEDREVIDPAALRLMLSRGDITDEQFERLQDYQWRTRMGVGCLNPTSPPREIAPYHTKGALCRVQRCTLCKHAMVFADSLEPLSYRRAELRWIEANMAIETFLASTYPDEIEVLDATLEKFDTGQVNIFLERFYEQMCNGKLKVSDTDALYVEELIK